MLVLIIYYNNNSGQSMTPVSVLINLSNLPSGFVFSAIGVVVLLDHLHYRDGTWLEFGQLGDSVKKA